MTEKEKHVLKHTLGLDRAEKPYRNYFVAGNGHHDMDALESLVSKGFMRCRKDPFDEVSNSMVYHVTEEGKAAVAIA